MMQLATYVQSATLCYIQQSTVQHKVTALKKGSYARNLIVNLRYFLNKCRTFVNQLRKAQLNCANWNTGKCCGVMLKIKQERKAGFKYYIHQVLDTDLADKDCIVDKGCAYFNNFVLPGLVDR